MAHPFIFLQWFSPNPFVLFPRYLCCNQGWMEARDQWMRIVISSIARGSRCHAGKDLPIIPAHIELFTMSSLFGDVCWMELCGPNSFDRCAEDWHPRGQFSCIFDPYVWPLVLFISDPLAKTFTLQIMQICCSPLDSFHMGQATEQSITITHSFEWRECIISVTMT